ncbi:MAG: hypothetical protein GWN99_14695 [Gemmatimonadetes bacterium]|uniref:Uncharacterized protein n=1 Tax=Candidatus Kutchimonas denitrificans TaxID=3056748 RepID=A0AAE4ZCW1_9BACT|nr:hypothetical protein [Gemmatimonadota bacterium]NIR76271.1 hypothetical protein [Candidatus Kutchimonas denitrificans]NIS02294.1 hypothetical protein [Gemmatimonadota bacterium]NIT68113.1 hypothetical protein [Gemmatimonadota bacterium]NIU54337.1 hypothetical protein [Gemmatimonadota bacterium]
MQKPGLSTLVLTSIGLLFAALVVVLIVSSLVRPSVREFAPTAPNPEAVGERSVGPRLYTVDATAHDRWVYFDFSRGSVVDVDSRRSLDWDLAFQRHRMISNGGDTNPAGRGAVADLGPIRIDSALTVPEDDWTTDEGRGDTPRNPVLEDWYDYSWTSHILRPADRVLAIRTADGRYAALRFVGYYCPGGRPGCVSFVYRYQGDGSKTFAPAAASAADSAANGTAAG